MTNKPWVEKYRPRSFKEDWIGDDETRALIDGFFFRWNLGDPISKVMILHGPPGVGKTSAVYAYAADMKWTVREFNAGESRTKAVLKKALNESMVRPVDGGLKIILLDEVEGTTVAKAIDSLRPEWKRVACPIVITSNDVSGFPNNLLSYSLPLKIGAPPKEDRLRVLRNINKAEGLNVPFLDLARIASKTKTMRSAIATFQMCVIAADFEHIKAVDLSPGFNDHLLNYLNGKGLRPPGVSTGLILRLYETNHLPPKDVMELNILLKRSKSVAGLSKITDVFADMCTGDVRYLRFPKSRAKDILGKVSHVKREKKSQRKKKRGQKGKKPSKRPQLKVSSWGSFG